MNTKHDLKNRSVSLKTVCVTAFLVGLLVFGMTYYVLSPATINVYLDDLPSQAYYTVKTDDNTNFWIVRNDGSKLSESTSLGTVMQYAITNVPEGQTIAVMPMVKECTALVIPADKSLTIQGLGTRMEMSGAGYLGVTFVYYGTDWFIKTTGSASEQAQVTIKNINIQLGKTTSPHALGAISLVNCAVVDLEDITIKYQEYTPNATQIGVYLEADTPEDGYIKYIRTAFVGIGFKLNFPSLVVDNCFVDYPSIGFQVTNDNGLHQTYLNPDIEGDSARNTLLIGYDFQYLSRATLINPSIVDLANVGTYAFKFGSACDKVTLINPIFSGASATAAKFLYAGESSDLRILGSWNFTKVGTSTGTGSQQAIYHGLAFTPTNASIILTDIEEAANAYISAAANATYIHVTAVNGKDYRWQVSYSPP